MKFIKKYFLIWWIPIISYLVPYVIFQLGLLLKKDDIVDFSLILFYINILGNIASSIVQIVIKKWYLLFPQLIISAFLFFFVSVYLAFSPPDFYGANKTIPKNVKFETPVEKEITEKDLKLNDFRLAEISQPGIYSFYTNHQPKVAGYFFIKAFEITSNERLSEERINEQSKIVVEKPSAKIYKGGFTIYEGSWGDKYGARIELCYKPNNDKEYKVNQKNYIVEGWMR
ncbi:hypothetical protein LNP04_07035 [Chryseobacterium sp. C-71]|uniref:hypothetical protein n=1 Tax=Chryseobacterium sp. C-71 TaxID=2893882 RepID=UPI001E3EFCF1|nr:hypothetical protein [Chryseobacterium sp. C-71]UFH33455.1 hypothetical protein LNP04_07035 [Chryseobacterium sp. C-71]